LTKVVCVVLAAATVVMGCTSAKHAAPGSTTTVASTTTAPGDPAKAGASASRDVATATLPALGPSPHFVEISRFRGPAPAAGLTTAIQGIALVLRGIQSIGFREGPRLVIRSVGAGGGVVVGPQANLFDRSATADDLLFACLRPSTDRGALVAVSAAKVAYVSDDLTGLPPGPVQETLTVIEEQPGGRDGAHTHPGPAVELVLDGNVTFRLGGKPPLTLGAGGAFVADANELVQPVNAGRSVARLIEFVVAPAGLPARAEVDQVPQA
jgi:quercetin dioxygenase-like cupin family protein